MPVDKFGGGGNSTTVTPKVCNTLAFATLGDVREFDAPGLLRVVYGLELAENGYYRRAPVVAPDRPSWDIMITLSRPYCYFKSKEVVRLENQGTMLATYIRTGKGGVEVNGEGRFYILAAGKTARTAKLKADTEFPRDLDYLKKPPVGSTIWLEAVLGESPKDWIDLLPGLSIKWKTPQIVALIIQNSGGTFNVRASSPEVEIKAPVGAISVAEILFSTYAGFLRLLVSLTEVSDEYLETLLSKLDHIQPPISSG